MLLPFEPKHVALFAAVIFVLYVFIRPVLVYLVDPLKLRKYPSPSFLASISSLWLLKETWNEKRARTIHEAHKKLGDVIRVSPNQLLFDIPAAVNDIYGHQASRKLSKDVFYDGLGGDEYDIVSVRDHADHGMRRRYLSNSFALRTVVEMEPVIRENFGRVLDHVDGVVLLDAKQGVFDIRQWLNFFTLDVIGDMAFGLPMGFTSHGSDTKEARTADGRYYDVEGTVKSLHRTTRRAVTVSQFISSKTMNWVKTWTALTPLVNEMTNATVSAHFDHICLNQLRRRLEKGPAERPQGDFFGRILEDRDGNERGIPFPQLLAETIMMMNAGSETTAAALSNTVYFLLRNPRAMRQLRAEVDAHVAVDDERKILEYELVRELPFLRACIDESLRLRPPIAYALQRRVDAPEGVVVAGHHVKQGTVVAAPPYSVHRNAELFPNPDAYEPERWLDPTQAANLNRYNIVFSQGPRQCLGRHIAIVELQIVVSSLVRRYDMALLGEEQELLTFDRFISNPGPLPIRIFQRARAL